MFLDDADETFQQYPRDADDPPAWAADRHNGEHLPAWQGDDDVDNNDNDDDNVDDDDDKVPLVNLEGRYIKNIIMIMIKNLEGSFWKDYLMESPNYWERRAGGCSLS